MKTSIALAVPSTDLWHADFGVCFAQLIAYLCSEPLPGFKSQRFHICNTKGSMIPKSRTLLVREALRVEAQYILFLDSDMVFPRETAHQLVSHQKQAVAANCVIRQIPSSPTARYKSDKYSFGEPVFTDPTSTGLEKVWRVGTGVMLLETTLLRRLGEPWFDMTWINIPEYDEPQLVGEDWKLCERLEEEGIPIYVDHDLSKEIGHIGTLHHTHSYVGEVKEPRNA